MDYFPSCLEWKLQALSLPCQISSVFLLCFCFYFLLSKSNKADLSAGGSPAVLLVLCSLALHSPLWQRAQDTQKPAPYPGFPAPRPSSGSQKTPVSTCSTQPSAEEVGGLLTPNGSWGSQSSCVLCYSLGGQQEGNLPAVQAGDLKFGDLLPSASLESKHTSALHVL